jgi:uncharacterized protein (DUF58 family)
MDFADFRHYVRGDDLRHIDWNVYARMDKLFVKIFHEEQDLQCHVLIDTSLSMQFGEPDKLQYARRLAAAVAYVELTGQNKVSIRCFGNTTHATFGPSRGRHQVRRMFEYLNRNEAAGGTSLYRACHEFSGWVRGRGIVILISDLLDPAGFEPALRYLVRDSFDVYVLHVLSPQEIEPPLNGHLELTDIELGGKVEITVNKRLKDLYQHNLQAFITQVNGWCTGRGIVCPLIRTDNPVEDLVLKQLRGFGLLNV